jgi:hypothetical protein
LNFSVNKEIIIIAAVSIVFLIGVKIAYGQSANLLDETNRTQLIDFIKMSDIYANVSLNSLDKQQGKAELNYILPYMTQQELETLAKEIVNNGNPIEIVEQAKEEQTASSLRSCEINANLC